LRAKLKEVEPDLIYSNGIKTHALLWLAGTGRKPVLWHVHDFVSRRALARRVLGRAVGKTAGVIAISEAVAADLRGLWPTVNVHTVRNSIDIHAFCPGPAAPDLLDSLAKLPTKSCLRVGLVATYARWKGHDVFLRAAARVLRDRPELAVRFFVVGGPIYATPGSQYSRKELQTLVNQMGIADSVGFIDYQADVRPIFRSLDVVVHASTEPEPFGLTIIEAMACGRPVVVSQAGGAAEIIRSEHDGLGVEPGGERSLCEAMCRLLGDDVLRANLGAKARQTVCDRFDQRRFDEEIVEVVGARGGEYSKAGCDIKNHTHRSFTWNIINLHIFFKMVM
jgi:glycosyltransferase involved in cell wall biosynthesis